MGCTSSKPADDRQVYSTGTHKETSVLAASEVSLTASTRKAAQPPAVPHSNGHLDDQQSNGYAHDSVGPAAARGVTDVPASSALLANGIAVPAVQTPADAEEAASTSVGVKAPHQQERQEQHQQQEEQQQQQQQQSFTNDGTADASDASPSDASAVVTKHKYVDVITREDGAETVMLRADAGSAAADFVGAPVLQEDSMRCELTRSLHTGGAPSKERHDPRFDSITKLMSTIFSMPVALVVFIDSTFCYIKSGVGMDQYEPTERHMSFCTWTLVPVNPEILVIHDATKDGRFASHPYVKGEPYIRFYAGAPLVASNGHRLGTMCVVDYKPHKFDAECCNILANFAEMVVRDVERYAVLEERADVQRRASLEQSRVDKALVRAIHAKPDGYILCNPQLEGWPILFTNEAWRAAADEGGDDAERSFWDVFEPLRPETSQADPTAAYQSAINHGGGFLVQARRRGNAASSPVFTIVFRPAALDKLDKDMVNIRIPAIPTKADDQQPTAYYFGMIRQITSGSLDSVAASFEEEERVPFDDIILSGLLGKGSYGNVYFGVWQKSNEWQMDVAVKVIEHKLTATEKDSIKQELEATVGLQLDHPNVVHTYKHVTRVMSSSRDLIRSWKDSTSGSVARHSAESFQNGHPASSGLGSAGYFGSDMSDQSTSGHREGSNIADFGSSVRASSGFTRGSQSRRCETWIVLELCSLGSLQGAIDGGAFRVTSSVYDGLPDLPTILLTALEVARALEYLHGKNILHGDLTANNILLVDAAEDDIRNFSAKVSDFGLSRVVPSETAISTNTCGTITHMPPELINDGKMSKAVDVYGFGVLLWELYVGERPWAGLRPVQIILKKTTGRANLAFPPGTPAAYKDVAEACTQPDPTVRPPFAKLVADLTALLAAAEAGTLQPGEAFAIYQQWASAGGGACGVPAPDASAPGAYCGGM